MTKEIQKLFGPIVLEHYDTKDSKIMSFGTPIKLHGVNPRNMLGDIYWTKIRTEVYKKANYKCEICGESGLEQGFQWPVEAHEKWDFDFKNEVQIFMGVLALCPICHKIYHWDQPEMQYKSGNMTREEFRRINKLRDEKMKILSPRGVSRIKGFLVWHEGNWKSDFSYLEKMGYPLRLTFDSKWSGHWVLNDEKLYERGNPLKALF